jgi:endonuclease YncB( thermonuclease family)
LGDISDFAQWKRRRSRRGSERATRKRAWLPTPVEVGLSCVVAILAVTAWFAVAPEQSTNPVAAATSAGALAGRSSVIDGDTLEIRGARVRLVGIDAPESGQSCQDAAGQPWRCGQQAALALADRIGSATVACEGEELDRYGRLLAVCRARGEDLGGWLVYEGLALAYRRYSEVYVGQENAARAARRGVWAGTFVPPWDWRAQDGAHQEAQAQPQPLVPAPADAQNVGSCSIKGNINSKGDRIYHVPGGRWYDKTKISENKGERWFCNEAEARAAGWRRSKQ